ncbi:TetR family transcriptional regulator [Kerstersia sp.]|uniref:TetR family transcriptional regulator n=1 Tax=Kerstersia sp. TaxID=1930783 RepID=UPI003F8FB8E4
MASSLPLNPRKNPQQARSEGLVAAILEAAAQVLAEEGAARFTTARVAERAGVSVGSLYQYFPNKAAILFRLQVNEWQRTSSMMRRIVEDLSKPAHDRIRELVQVFIHSECEEAAMRVALSDAAPLYRDTQETRVFRRAGRETIRQYIAGALPASVPADAQTTAAEMIRLTLTSAGKRFSESPRTQDEITRCAEAMADMFIAYIDALEQRHNTGSGQA